MSGGDAEPVEGWVASDVRAEFPDLRLVFTRLTAAVTPSPPELKDRLRDLSDGFRGPQAVMLRQQPIPSAYRVFFRHIGLDPDVERVPVEALAVERLKAGGFTSRNSLDDALTIATMETSVPLWALDADTLDGDPGIRIARGGEPLGRAEGGASVPDGRMVVADDAGPLAILFGDVARGHGVTYGTSRIVLFSVTVAGVPPIHVEEAMWLCEEILVPGA